LTVHLAPEEVVAALSAEFKDDLRSPEIEAAVERIEAALGKAHPEIRILFVKPQTGEKWRERHRRLEEAAKEEARA
jgi:divalent metal cation (Fe/Co/Zn/Cd) transporter